MAHHEDDRSDEEPNSDVPSKKQRARKYNRPAWRRGGEDTEDEEETPEDMSNMSVEQRASVLNTGRRPWN